MKSSLNIYSILTGLTNNSMYSKFIDSRGAWARIKLMATALIYFRLQGVQWTYESGVIVRGWVDFSTDTVYITKIKER